MKKSSDTFIAFDLETTGLGETDRIIEFGAAKFRKCKIVDTFQALVNPGIHIPWEVYSLTGISKQEIREAPPFDAVRKEIRSFIGKETLVAHNAPFDISFLERQMSALENPIIDTLKLARILLPYATNHKLETLYELFESGEPEFHRALDDAIATGKVFLHLRSLLNQLPAEVLKSLGAIARTFDDHTSALMVTSMSTLMTRTEAFKKDHFRELQGPPINVMRFEPSDAPPPVEPTEASVMQLLSNGSMLSKALDTYEVREEQKNLSAHVANCLQRNEILVSEAGTGTGKTFAYLIPSILWSSFHEERILVSTYTKNLEDQIFHRDLRAILSSLRLPFAACIIKGRNNYVCQKRWDEMMHISFHGLDDEEREALLKLVVWKYYTITGDISENSGFWLHEHYSLWKKLSSDMKDCEMHSCPYFPECYLATIRRAAQEANIVVLNHALLFTDLQSDQKIVGDYDRLVIDEAHNLERAATDFLGISVSSIQLQSILDRLLRRGKGFLSNIKDILDIYGEDRTGADHSTVLSAMDSVDDARHGSEELFLQILDAIGKVEYKGSMRLKQGQSLIEDIEPLNQALYDHFHLIAEVLRSFLKDISENLQGTIDKRLHEEGMQLLEDIEQCSNDLFSILSCSRQDFCYWVEASENGSFLKFIGAPINVSPILRSNLFDPLQSAVLVSASILVEGGFEYFLGKVGLSGYERVQTLALGSSFDYSKQVFSVVPLFISDPQQKEFLVDVADILRKVVLRTRRGTLVLFTSYRLLNGVYDYLVEPFHQSGIPLLAQGRSGSRYTIAREFRDITHSVLLGTYSFWEGFDVPGNALENLVITKLPFPAPNEPMMEARGEYLESKGLSPFDNLFVPEAIIRLRQGFGRLVRSKQDRGIIIILDTRIMRRNYGKRFLLSLPAQVTGSYYEEDFFGSIDQFWKT